MINALIKINTVIKPFRGKFLVLVFYSFILNIFTFLNPLILKFIFDDGVMKRNILLFLILVSSFVGVAIIWRVLNFYYSLALEKFKLIVSRFWIRKTMEAFLDYPYESVISRDTGYFLSRIYDEPDTVATELIVNTIDFVNLLFGVLISFGLLIYFSLYATLILTLIVPFFYWLSSKYPGKIQLFTQREREKEAELRETITDSVKSFKMIRTFGMKDYVVNRFLRKINEFIGVYLKNFRFAGIYETLSSIYMSISELSVIVVSGYLIIIGKMTFGSFMGFMNTFWGFLGAIERFVGLTPSIASGLAIYDRVSQFLSKKSARTVKTGKNLVLRNINFCYGDVKILENFSLQVKPGDKVLVKGDNGSGKTTLAHIIAGLLKPTGDVILFERVSIMPEKFLNLKLREYRIIDERDLFDELLYKLNLKDLMEKYPIELSAGQRRKFAILLTLMRNADIYIFDEPLANIDDSSKNFIIDLIFEYVKDKATILISHDSGLLQDRFNKVIFLRR